MSHKPYVPCPAHAKLEAVLQRLGDRFSQYQQHTATVLANFGSSAARATPNIGCSEHNPPEPCVAESRKRARCEAAEAQDPGMSGN